MCVRVGKFHASASSRAAAGLKPNVLSCTAAPWAAFAFQPLEVQPAEALQVCR